MGIYEAWSFFKNNVAQIFGMKSDLEQVRSETLKLLTIAEQSQRPDLAARSRAIIKKLDEALRRWEPWHAKLLKYKPELATAAQQTPTLQALEGAFLVPIVVSVLIGAVILYRYLVRVKEMSMEENENIRGELYARGGVSSVISYLSGMPTWGYAVAGGMLLLLMIRR